MSACRHGECKASTIAELEHKEHSAPPILEKFHYDIDGEDFFALFAVSGLSARRTGTAERGRKAAGSERERESEIIPSQRDTANMYDFSK